MSSAPISSHPRFSYYLNQIVGPCLLNNKLSWNIIITEPQRLALIEALSVSGDEHGYDKAHSELLAVLEALPRAPMKDLPYD